MVGVERGGCSDGGAWMSVEGLGWRCRDVSALKGKGSEEGQPWWVGWREYSCRVGRGGNNAAMMGGVREMS